MTPSRQVIGVFLDLDNTLFFSGESGAGLAGRLASLATLATVVPTSTRNPSQFERLNPALFFGGEYAILSNGATILVDGIPDEPWATWMAARVAAECAPFAEVKRRSAAIDQQLRSHRDDGDFHSLRVITADAARASAIRDRLKAAMLGTNWVVRRSGRKVYLHPSVVSKLEAVEHLIGRLGLSTVIASGDSEFDTGMLARASLAIVPRGSELNRAGLVERGWKITAGRGHCAAREIVEAAIEFASASVNSASRIPDRGKRSGTLQ